MALAPVITTVMDYSDKPHTELLWFPVFVVRNTRSYKGPQTTTALEGNDDWWGVRHLHIVINGVNRDRRTYHKTKILRMLDHTSPWPLTCDRGYPFTNWGWNTIACSPSDEDYQMVLDTAKRECGLPLRSIPCVSPFTEPIPRFRCDCEGWCEMH